MSLEAFQQFVSSVENEPGYARPAAFAVGLATLALDADGNPNTDVIVDTWYPCPNLGENFGTAAVLAHSVGHKSGTASYRVDAEVLQKALAHFAPFEGDGKRHANIDALKSVLGGLQRSLSAQQAYKKGETTVDRALPRAAVVTFIDDLKSAPVDAHDIYLKLHLMSARKTRPHTCNLDGMFGKLTNVAWTTVGPFAVDTFEQARMRLRAEGVACNVLSVDKFPRMVDYVLPSGVRIGDADRVRLGAHLGEGTTVMHEGFVNFNAGTLGASMVEGRISAGVVVGNGSDVGGGASIMGTLSGGGKEIISLGESCLLGANSGCGIVLGNNCTIEAGCYVTAGSKVTMPDGAVVKAKELSGKDNLLFIRNSQTGAIEVRFKKNTTELNAALHKN